MLISWNELPQYMKNEEVKRYYNILKKRKGALILKRLFDIAVSLLLIIFLLPFLLIIALIIKIDSPGKVIFAQERITRAGKWLRKLRADEFPQIFNILSGELSFVGVRPEVTKYVKEYSPEMYATLLLPAGVTSMTSILYKNEAELLKNADDPDSVYITEILPEKMKYNLEYIKNFGFWYDIKIMIKTVFAVIKK